MHVVHDTTYDTPIVSSLRRKGPLITKSIPNNKGSKGSMVWFFRQIYKLPKISFNIFFFTLPPETLLPTMPPISKKMIHHV
jgi:hypothetical protein